VIPIGKELILVAIFVDLCPDIMQSFHDSIFLKDASLLSQIELRENRNPSICQSKLNSYSVWNPITLENSALNEQNQKGESRTLPCRKCPNSLLDCRAKTAAGRNMPISLTDVDAGHENLYLKSRSHGWTDIYLASVKIIWDLYLVRKCTERSNAVTTGIFVA